MFHCAHEGFKHGGVIVKLFIPNENEEDDHTELRIESLLKVCCVFPVLYPALAVPGCDIFGAVPVFGVSSPERGAVRVGGDSA